MNKEELIRILQERSQDSINEDLTDETSSRPPNEYLKKLKVRRKDDKTIFKLTASIVILTCALIYSIYLNVEKKPVDLSQYVKKEFVTFDNLSIQEQDKYIPKSQMQSFQNQLRSNDKNRISELLEANEALDVQLKTALKEKQALLTKAKSKTKRYNATGCYNEGAGNKNINGQCKDKISKFLVKNQKKAIKFEIIAVLDKKDSAFIQNKINQVKASKAIKNSLKEFLRQGLARTRVLEAAYLVKDVLGEKPLISYVNYIAKSESKRGITIRAYY